MFIHHKPDPSFPNGIPNPLLKINRRSTSKAIIEVGADFGVAFDGDFDRCFIFDHLGNFINGEYIIGLLAEIFLNKEEGANIVHDPRVVWNTIDVVNKFRGRAVTSKTGHAFMKAKMRKNRAVYGGEMSAHHYFRDFHYCDSGMIPWLLLWELLSQKETLLMDLIAERENCFPSSGEINFKAIDAEKCIEDLKNFFVSDAISIDELDGLSMTFDTWRFNLQVKHRTNCTS